MKTQVRQMHNNLAFDNWLKIGEVAARSGISVKTIRYYEDLGLLAPTVERSNVGYRMFQVDVIKRLEFIKRAQSLGLHLREIQTLLAVYDRGELPCPEVKQQLQIKVGAIAAQIQALENLKSQLQVLLDRWEEQPQFEQLCHTICPNLLAGIGSNTSVPDSIK